MDETESDDGDDIEVESEQDSDGEEDLQLEVDDAHNTSKVSIYIWYTFEDLVNFFLNEDIYYILFEFVAFYFNKSNQKHFSY